LFSFPYDFSHRRRAVRTAFHGVAVTVRDRAFAKAFRGSSRPFLLVTAGVLTGAALLSFGGRLLQLRITLTDSSAPAGIYRLAAAPAERGALVAACLPAAIARTGLARGYLRKGDCPAEAEPVAKVIAAVTGDVVEVEADWVAVNGVRFMNSRTAARDSAGRPLHHVAWGGRRVGAGEIWLFGFNDARSWDARYFGPVPVASIRGVLKPVLTW
jgi:conjugative transfer signal peptidase TraF